MTRVLMLGWEFPPFITGGLGTACYGLTRAMSRCGMDVTFVMPKSSDDAANLHDHVDLLSPQVYEPSPHAAESNAAQEGADPALEEIEGVEFVRIPASFSSPYPQGTTLADLVASIRGSSSRVGPTDLPGVFSDEPVADHGGEATPVDAGYGDDLVRQVEQYAWFCLRSCRRREYDVIHAHDWMTYPAGMWLARVSGRPLVIHVHSTEFDRSGENVNQQVYDIERRGMHAARKIIAVSQLTKNVIVNRYGIDADKVEVVYNGVDLEPADVGATGIQRDDKLVLYFGRITYQKGPEYFVRAAKRVLDVMDDVKFLVAGDGDQAIGMMQMAADLGIGHKVLFTGFLRGGNIQRIFSLADLYVMPSVSEPFGIAPLEAMSNDVPVLISKSSGVSEVLTHALKVDFWDVDEIANQIVAVLRHPPLGNTLRHHAAMEVRGIKWDGAAARCAQVYESVVREMVALGV